MNWEDPIVADVRRIREELSAKFAFDLAAIFADIRARQAGAGDRLIRLAGDPQAEPADAREATIGSSSTTVSLALPA
jgi:hypothetical protein